MIKLKNILNEGSADGGKMAKTHVVYAMNVKLNDKNSLGDNEVETGFRVSVKKGPDAESRAKKLAQQHFGKNFNSIIGISKALNPEKSSISEAGLKGAEDVPSNKKLAQLSDNDKLKIVQSVGNLISFKVPDWSKGRRNFWTVISAGKIVKKKNLDGITIFILPGKGPEKVSPSYSSVKDLLDGVDWDTMELRRESVSETKPSINERKYYVTYNRGRGQGKGLEMEFDPKTFKPTGKPKVFSSYNDAKKYAEKMEKIFRNSIGGSTAYWVSDEKMNQIEETIKEGVSDIKQFRNKPADTWNDTMIKLVLMRKVEGKTAVYRLETDNWFRRFENPGKGYGLMIRGIKIAAQPTKAPASFAYGENQSVFKAIIQYLPNEFVNVEDDVKENYETAQGYIILGNKNFTGFEMQQVLSIKDLEGFIKANMDNYKP
jgi:hypothetical protein